jgi:hypothetical protein
MKHGPKPQSWLINGCRRTAARFLNQCKGGRQGPRDQGTKGPRKQRRPLHVSNPFKSSPGAELGKGHWEQSWNGTGGCILRSVVFAWVRCFMLPGAFLVPRSLGPLFPAFTALPWHESTARRVNRDPGGTARGQSRNSSRRRGDHHGRRASPRCPKPRNRPPRATRRWCAAL